MESHLETQLWLWLDTCEREKPWVGKAVLEPSDKVVSFLQDEVHEGDEAKEAEDFPS